MIWAAVLLGSLGCYVVKVAGLSIPQGLLQNDRVRRVATLLPVALLTALIAIQTFSAVHRLTFDPRVAGFGAAAIAVRLRAPFLVVVVVAASVTALLRLIT